MIVSNNINDPALKGAVATIGFFDGVHLGHRHIIEKLVTTAKRLGTKSLLITLWPHPRLVLSNDTHGLKLLSSIAEKIETIEDEGVNAMLVLEFTKSLAETPAKDFVYNILVDSLRIKRFIVGYNNVFGKNGEGNFHLLKQFETDGYFRSEQVEPIKIDNISVSSSKIRTALEIGNVSLAKRMLSRPYSLTGTIEGGQQIGRSIGFPTANILPNEPLKLIPAQGVYAVWVSFKDEVYPAMLNIGTRPTLGDGLYQTIEAHIIGFNRNIYNKTITILFEERLRDEMKFSSINALKEQLANDKENALRVLGFTN
jgi:riboflavin kinase/FMN adenylyltransferase